MVMTTPVRVLSIANGPCAITSAVVARFEAERQALALGVGFLEVLLRSAIVEEDCSHKAVSCTHRLPGVLLFDPRSSR